MAADATHSPAPEELMEYLDGEGSAAWRAGIETHLATCASCQALAADQRGLSCDLGAWQVTPVPDRMRAPGLRAGAPAVTRRWRPTRFALAGLSAAAAVLIVASYEIPKTTRRATAQPLVVAEENGQLKSQVDMKVEANGGSPRATPVAGEAQGQGGGRVAGLVAAAPGHVRTLIRTAQLQLVATDFGHARAAVEQIVESADGLADQLAVSADPGSARALRAMLRVPGDRLAETLGRLRALGQVTQDQQGAEDVADQLVDLDARLKSARATEQRLIDLLRERTGKLSDVLEVEQELTRVRLDIERLDAEKTNMSRRVAYATINLTISEERKAGLGPLPLWTQLRIAAADGLQNVVDTLVGIALFALRAGPALALWVVFLATAWLVVKRVRTDRRSA